MTEMEAAEARDRIEEMLARAEAGETVLITRGGRTIARLQPEKLETARDRAQMFRDIEAIRRTMPRVPAAEILTWRDEGRKR